MNRLATFLVLACTSLALAGGGCGGASRSAAPTPTPGDPSLITGSGTVRFLDLEGGFYGIVADDSSRYDPGELDPRLRRDGLRVRFDLRKLEGAMSIRQWGTLVTVVRIDSL